MTDTDILNRLKDGSLRVNPRTTRVISITEARGERTILPDKDNRRFRFMRITHNGSMKRIALHRLVWMSVNLKLIPAGYDVFHNTTNKAVLHPDGISHLELREL